VVALILLWSAWFTVQPEETGIVQRFGKVVRTAGPGLHIKLPFVQEVRTIREAPPYPGWGSEPDSDQREGVHLGGHHGPPAHR
jgi:hypothetical protein